MERKRIFAGMLIICLALSGCGTSEDSMETDIEKIELQSNQEIVIGKITQIAGNEITYTVAEESDMSQRPENSSDSGNVKASRRSEQKTMYSLTDESDTRIIPVGTTVITSLGNKTTFSRLSNGDIIKILVETDSAGEQVIIGIWMV